MAANTLPIFAVKPKVWPAQITDVSGTTPVTVATGGANGSIIEGLIGTSTDSTIRVVSVILTRGSTNYYLGAVKFSSTEGTDGDSVSKNILSETEMNLMSGPVVLESGDILKVAAQSTLTVGSEIAVTAFGGDY